MKALVSIVMGSISDLPVMEKAADFLNEQGIPFEMCTLSAHRTPGKVAGFAQQAKGRGIQIIIAGAGMAAALPGVIAANTTLPVIGVPINSGPLMGVDALYAMVQMPPGVPVATMAVNGGQNAALMAAEILALSDAKIAGKLDDYKKKSASKVTQANEVLGNVKYDFRVI